MFGLTNLLAKAGLTRDSRILDWAAIAAVLTYLTKMPPPTQWTYEHWMAAALAAVIWYTRTLKTSNLPGENDRNRVSDPGARSFLLPFLLVGSLLATSCAGLTPAVTPNPTQEQVDTTRAQALKIARAAESGGELLVRMVRAAIAAREAGVPKSQTDILMRAVDRLEPHDSNQVHTGICSWTLLDAIEKATTEPELRQTVGVLLNLVVPVLEAAAATKDSAVAELAGRLRDAYALASAFFGREDELWTVNPVPSPLQVGGAR